MAWSKFEAFDVISKQKNLPFLVGVVPNNKDPKLNVEKTHEAFWDSIRQWKTRGWTIAQHGYTHEYLTKNGGLLNLSGKSEFAGLSYDVQVERLLAGKTIMEKEQVWDPVFMAPSHSFDTNTLKALKQLGFKAITDGYGLYPYELHGLQAVPQLFSSGKSLCFGVYTVCIHINTISEVQMRALLQFISSNRANIIPFEDALNIKCPMPGYATFTKISTEYMLRLYRFRSRQKGLSAQIN